MIFDRATGLVVDNLAWVDRSALWMFDLASQSERWVTSRISFVGMRDGREGFFLLRDGRSVESPISIRHASAPETERASVRYRGNAAEFSGDPALWRFVDTAVILLYDGEQRLFRVDAIGRRLIELDLAWYRNGAYDLGYQGLVDCLSLPEEDRVIVSVQRSSKLVVIDIERDCPASWINLAGRGGNPNLAMRTNTDFLASDYDTLCRVDVASLTMVRSERLQDTGQFIGDYQLLPDGTCLVARPFSGDVLVVNSEDFAVLGRAEVGGQPLRVCAVSEDRVVTRDWKTGKPTVAKLVLAG